MKQTKTFNVGDKVFAKVKGYPAWPAKIVRENGKKYDVTFYGTSETGSIKVEDLFYYIKHKEQFCKNLKRKDYIDAIEQIEAEIEASGTDGNTDSKNEAERVPLPDVADKKGKKRKLSKSLDKTQNIDEPSVKKSIGQRNSINSLGTDSSEPQESERTDEEKLTQESELAETDENSVVSPKNASAPTSRSGRIIKIKRFSDGEEEDIDKKTVKRRKSIGSRENQDELVKVEIEKKDAITSKRRMSVGSQENKAEPPKNENIEATETNTFGRKKVFGSKETQKQFAQGNQNQVDKEEEDSTDSSTEETKNSKEETVVNFKENELTVQEIDGNKENMDKQETKNEDVTKLQEEDVIQEQVEEEYLDVHSINIVTPDYLKAVTAYADYVRSKASIFKEKPIEHREKEENQVLIAKLPSGKLIGIRYNTDGASEHNTEFSRAEADEAEAKTILSLKDLIENGSCKPEDDPDMFVVNIKLDEAEFQWSNEMKINELKKKKVEIQKIEMGLVELDIKIKSCLGLDRAEPKKALEFLKAMMELEINSLMLRKHPHIVDMVKRLRRYVGNIKEWKLTGDGLETFEADAEKIRKKADEVFLKFKSLFTLPGEGSFWDAYTAEVERFKNDTKDLNEFQLFDLRSEPNSRQAFFDWYNDRHELDTLDTSENTNLEHSAAAPLETASTTIAAT